MPDSATSLQPPGNKNIHIRRLMLAVVLLNLLVYVIAAVWLRHSWNQAQTRVSTSTQNIALVLENSIDGMIGKIDVAVTGVLAEAEEGLTSGKSDRKEIEHHISRQCLAVPELDSIRMTDSEGRVLYGKGTTTSPLVTISDREYFQFLRDTPGAGMYISRPFFGRISKVWVFAVARRVNNPDGSFAGVVYGVVPIELFTRLFSSLDVGRDGAISLRDANLEGVVRFPEPGGVGSSVGQRSTMKEFIDLTRAGKLAGTFSGPSSLDGISRIYSFRKITTLPLYIVVGRSINEMRRVWRTEAIALISMIVLFSTVTVMFSLKLVRTWQQEQRTASELRNLNQQLEARVLDRTAELNTINQLLQTELNERKQIEDALRESENLLREAQTVAGLGTYSLDVATGRWNSSDILDDIFGIDEKFDRTLSGWESILHPEDHEMIANYLSDEVLGKLIPFNREYRIIRAVDGRTVWVHGMGRLEINGQGHPARMIGTIQDITIRKQAEEILSKSKEQYDNLVSRINVGIYLLRSTPEGSYSLDYVSPRMSELVNCSVESLRADCRSWFTQIHPEDRDGFITTNQEGITLRQPFDWTGRLLVEGAVRWLHIQSSPELLVDGDVLWHGVITDITERRLAEENLKKRDAEMEQFIYTVSHDLRSPLVTVKTFLGYLENDLNAGDHERISQDLQYIHGASDKMKVLLDELLELSRIDRQVNPPVRFSFRELLSEVCGALAGDITQYRIDMTLPDNDLELFGDRARLCQIWQNLVENAIKYRSDDRIPSIELGFHHDTNGVTFYVKDNGIGIAPGYHTKIFGVFEKLNPKSTGVGLGLTMIKRILEKYEGRIWVESDGPGQGCTFFFTLPRAISHVSTLEQMPA